MGAEARRLWVEEVGPAHPGAGGRGSAGATRRGGRCRR
jgi:hypothetical protein